MMIPHCWKNGLLNNKLRIKMVNLPILWVLIITTFFQASSVQALWSTLYTSDHLTAYVHLTNNSLLAVGPANESSLQMREIAQPPVNSTLAIAANNTLLAFSGSSFCSPLKVSVYSQKKNSWTNIDFNQSYSHVPRYKEYSLYISSPESSSVYIYGGRNLTDSCTNYITDDVYSSSDSESVLVSHEIFKLNLSNYTFESMDTATSPTEMFGAGVLRISSTSSLFVGGKASRGWVGMNQLALWEYSSWTFVSTSNSRKVDSRTNPLILPLYSPAGWNSSFDDSDESNSSWPIKNAIVIGGQVNGHDPLPFTVGLSLDNTTGWTWDPTLSQNLFNESLILGAVTFGNTLATFSKKNDSTTSSSEEKRKRDTTPSLTNYDIQLIDTNSWETIDSYSPSNLITPTSTSSSRASSSSPSTRSTSSASDSSSTTISTATSAPTSSRTVDTTTSPTATTTSESSPISTGGKIALSTVLPISFVLFAALLGVVLYRRRKVLKEEEVPRTPLMPLSPYLSGWFRPSTDRNSRGPNFEGIRPIDSIHSWEEKRRQYENAVANRNRMTILANNMNNNNNNNNHNAVSHTQYGPVEPSPFDEDSNRINPYSPTSEYVYGNAVSQSPSFSASSPTEEESSTSGNTHKRSKRAHPDDPFQEHASLLEPSVTPVTAAVPGYLSDPYYYGFHSRGRITSPIHAPSLNEDVSYHPSHDRENLVSPETVDTQTDLNFRHHGLTSPPPVAMVSGTRSDRLNGFTNGIQRESPHDLYSQTRKEGEDTSRKAGLLHRVSTLVSSFGRDGLLGNKRRKWSTISLKQTNNNNNNENTNNGERYDGPNPYKSQKILDLNEDFRELNNPSIGSDSIRSYEGNTNQPFFFSNGSISPTRDFAKGRPTHHYSKSNDSSNGGTADIFGIFNNPNNALGNGMMTDPSVYHDISLTGNKNTNSNEYNNNNDNINLNNDNTNNINNDGKINNTNNDNNADDDYDDDDDDIFHGRDVQILVSSRRRTQLRIANPDPDPPSRTNSERSTIASLKSISRMPGPNGGGALYSGPPSTGSGSNSRGLETIKDTQPRGSSSFNSDDEQDPKLEGDDDKDSNKDINSNTNYGMRNNNKGILSRSRTTIGHNKMGTLQVRKTRSLNNGGKNDEITNPSTGTGVFRRVRPPIPPPHSSSFSQASEVPLLSKNKLEPIKSGEEEETEEEEDDDDDDDDNEEYYNCEEQGEKDTKGKFRNHDSNKNDEIEADITSMKRKVSFSDDLESHQKTTTTTEKTSLLSSLSMSRPAGTAPAPQQRFKLAPSRSISASFGGLSGLLRMPTMPTRSNTTITPSSSSSSYSYSKKKDKLIIDNDIPNEDFKIRNHNNNNNKSGTKKEKEEEEEDITNTRIKPRAVSSGSSYAYHAV